MIWYKAKPNRKDAMENKTTMAISIRIILSLGLFKTMDLEKRTYFELLILYFRTVIGTMFQLLR